MIDRQYLTTGELAKFLERSRSWVQGQINCGKIKVISGSSQRDRVHNRISFEEALRLRKEQEPRIVKKHNEEILAILFRVSVRQVRKYYGDAINERHR